jgi:hypothetical protein
VDGEPCVRLKLQGTNDFALPLFLLRWNAGNAGKKEDKKDDSSRTSSWLGFISLSILHKAGYSQLQIKREFDDSFRSSRVSLDLTMANKAISKRFNAQST